jgi:pilus assembly protein CpaB
MAAGNRKNSGRIIILVAVVLILIVVLAAVFFWSQNLLGSNNDTSGEAVVQPVQQTAMANIVVIAQPVTRGTVITESVLTTIPYPQDQIVEGLFFENYEDVIDKKAKYDLPQGLPVTPSVLTEGAEGSYAAFRIPRGMVSITIPITQITSMAYGLQAGDHVNVITSMMLVDLDADFQTKLPNYSAVVAPAGSGSEETGTTVTSAISSGGAVSTQGRTELDVTLNQPIYVIPSESAQRPRLVSQTLVYDAEVLWVGRFPADGNISNPTTTTTTETQTAEGEAAPVVDPAYITLIVTPQDSLTINYLLLAHAKFNFVLRGAGDTEKTTTQAVTLQFVMDQYGIPYPSKLPYGMEPRNDRMYYTLDEYNMYAGQ